MKNVKIGVIGLGYVGLPLARLFATKYPTIGYDTNADKVSAINGAHDPTMEVGDDLLFEAIARHGFRATTDLEELRDCNFYVVAVPTPVDASNRPDLKPLMSASVAVGRVISKGDTVVYESTVYPGMTEEECLPIVEKVSGLKLNEDFTAGYSPERINPGDKEHTVATIRKITSGSTPEAADFVDAVYDSVVLNGTFKAASIKVAEAAKVIENTQRDVNIAFVNQLAIIFNAMGIDTHDVLEAASSKWNFQALTPGLVGGHCISVDPYYLIERSKKFGVLPRLFSSARHVNEKMAGFVVEQTVKLMLRRDIQVKDSEVLLLGLTFKENCADMRNTKVVNIYNELREYTDSVTVCDSWASPAQAQRDFGIKLSLFNPEELRGRFDAVILAVAHDEFRDIDARSFLKDPERGVVFDVKGVLPREQVDARL